MSYAHWTAITLLLAYAFCLCSYFPTVTSNVPSQLLSHASASLDKAKAAVHSASHSIHASALAATGAGKDVDGVNHHGIRSSVGHTPGTGLKQALLGQQQVSVPMAAVDEDEAEASGHDVNQSEHEEKGEEHAAA